jgi:hypothetical protein
LRHFERDGDFVLAEDALGLDEHQFPTVKELDAVTEVRESLDMHSLVFGTSDGVLEIGRRDTGLLNS